MLFGLFLLVVAVLFAYGSSSYRGMAGFVPLVLAVPTAILTLIVLLGERFPSLTSNFEVGLDDFLPTPAERGEHPRQPGPHRSELKNVAMTFGWFIAFGVLLFFAGFYVAMALFTFFFIKFQGSVGWLASLSVTILLEVFFYVLFEQTLNVNLFTGVFLGASVPPL